MIHGPEVIRSHPAQPSASASLPPPPGPARPCQGPTRHRGRPSSRRLPAQARRPRAPPARGPLPQAPPARVSLPSGRPARDHRVRAPGPSILAMPHSVPPEHLIPVPAMRTEAMAAHSRSTRTPPGECNHKGGAPRKGDRHTDRMRRRPHRARRRSRSRSCTGALRCGYAVRSAPRRGAREDGPRRNVAVSPTHHTAITNWAAPPGPAGDGSRHVGGDVPGRWAG